MDSVPAPAEVAGRADGPTWDPYYAPVPSLTASRMTSSPFFSVLPTPPPPPPPTAADLASASSSTEATRREPPPRPPPGLPTRQHPRHTTRPSLLRSHQAVLRPPGLAPAHGSCPSIQTTHVALSSGTFSPAYEHAATFPILRETLRGPSRCCPAPCSMEVSILPATLPGPALTWLSSPSNHQPALGGPFSAVT